MVASRVLLDDGARPGRNAGTDLHARQLFLARGKGGVDLSAVEEEVFDDEVDRFSKPESSEVAVRTHAAPRGGYTFPAAVPPPPPPSDIGSGLPPEWQAITSDQGTWFYNELTGESTWDRPLWNRASYHM